MRVMIYQRSRVLSGDVTFVIVAYFGYIHMFVSAWINHYKTERLKTLREQSHTTCLYISNNDYIYSLMFTHNLLEILQE